MSRPEQRPDCHQEPNPKQRALILKAAQQWVEQNMSEMRLIEDIGNPELTPCENQLCLVTFYLKEPNKKGKGGLKLVHLFVDEQTYQIKEAKIL